VITACLGLLECKSSSYGDGHVRIAYENKVYRL